MNLQNLSSDSLLRNLKFSVGEERRHLNIVLHHLREVERRKFHLEMGYPNLYAFATKELGYAEASAHRRISAMRLMKEILEIEEKLMSGSLTPSAVSRAHTHFRKEEIGVIEKQEIVKNLEGKSSREVERFFASLSPEAPTPERMRVISEDLTEIRMTVSRGTLEKLEELKRLVKKPQIDSSLPPTRSRYIAKAVRAEVKTRDEGRCQYRDSKTGKICGSQFYIQYDHIRPHALGGPSRTENLRLLCANHNKFVWQQMSMNLS